MLFAGNRKRLRPFFPSRYIITIKIAFSVKTVFLWNFNFEKGIKSITPRRVGPDFFSSPSDHCKKHWYLAVAYTSNEFVGACDKKPIRKKFRDSFSRETGLTDFIPALHSIPTYVCTGQQKFWTDTHETTFHQPKLLEIVTQLIWQTFFNYIIETIFLIFVCINNEECHIAHQFN